MRIKETIENEMIRNYITIYVQFLNQCATAKVAKLSSWLLRIYK